MQYVKLLFVFLLTMLPKSVVAHSCSAQGLSEAREALVQALGLGSDTVLWVNGESIAIIGDDVSGLGGTESDLDLLEVYELRDGEFVLVDFLTAHVPKHLRQWRDEFFETGDEVFVSSAASLSFSSSDSQACLGSLWAEELSSGYYKVHRKQGPLEANYSDIVSLLIERSKDLLVGQNTVHVAGDVSAQPGLLSNAPKNSDPRVVQRLDVTHKKHGFTRVTTQIPFREYLRTLPYDDQSDLYYLSFLSTEDGFTYHGDATKLSLGYMLGQDASSLDLSGQVYLGNGIDAVAALRIDQQNIDVSQAYAQYTISPVMAGLVRFRLGRFNIDQSGVFMNALKFQSDTEGYSGLSAYLGTDGPVQSSFSLQSAKYNSNWDAVFGSSANWQKIDGSTKKFAHFFVGKELDNKVNLEISGQFDLGDINSSTFGLYLSLPLGSAAKNTINTQGYVALSSPASSPILSLQRQDRMAYFQNTKRYVTQNWNNMFRNDLDR